MSTRTGLVLEVGGGHRPSPRADVLVDKDLVRDAERGGALVRDRPLVIADGEALPFRDGAFAHSIGRQVMEHMHDVEAFFAECERVSAAGYLSAPSLWREHLFGWPYHRWVFLWEEGVLLCARKPADFPCGGPLAHELARTSAAFDRALRSLPPSLLHVRLHWRGRIPYRVLDAPPSAGAGGLERLARAVAASGSGRRWGDRILRAAPRPALRLLDAARRLPARARGRRRRRVDLASLLVCPACKGELARARHGYGCAPCGHDFPLVDGVPHFLLPRSARGSAA